MYTVTLKNNKKFVCNSDETILSAALKNGFLLNYSCRTGNCLSCKYKILEGDTSCANEEIVLTDEEKSQGYVLLCQRKPLSNIKIEGEDLSEYDISKPSIIPSRINEISSKTNDIICVSLRVPPNTIINFLPGQYLDVIRDNIKRSYSIASQISDANIELLIRRYENGKMSDYWFNNAKVNDLIRLELPKGTFFLRNNGSIKTVVFLATGTGIAPVKSIIESYSDYLMRLYNRVIILWGMRYENEIFWKPDYDFIEFIPVLSRANSTKTYVQDLLPTLNIEWSNSAIYACGSLHMIISAFKAACKLGLKEDNFYSDAFVKSNQ